MADPEVITTPCTPLAAAYDEVDALADLLWLVFLAGEGMATVGSPGTELEFAL